MTNKKFAEEYLHNYSEHYAIAYKGKKLIVEITSGECDANFDATVHRYSWEVCIRLNGTSIWKRKRMTTNSNTVKSFEEELFGIFIQEIIFAGFASLWLSSKELKERRFPKL